MRGFSTFLSSVPLVAGQGDGSEGCSGCTESDGSTGWWMEAAAATCKLLPLCPAGWAMPVQPAKGGHCPHPALDFLL